MSESGAKLDAGLYVGLRMDGRVRASGIVSFLFLDLDAQSCV